MGSLRQTWGIFQGFIQSSFARVGQICGNVAPFKTPKMHFHQSETAGSEVFLHKSFTNWRLCCETFAKHRGPEALELHTSSPSAARGGEARVPSFLKSV